MDAAVSAVTATLKRCGTLSLRAQRVLRAVVIQRPEVAVKSLATALLYEGYRRSSIPRPGGTRTKELADCAEEAILREVQAYASGGGVVLAKGFVSPAAVCAEMAKQWMQGFGSSPEVLEAPQDEELNARLALAAQALGLLLLREAGMESGLDQLSSVSADPEGLQVCVQNPERFCMQAARAMLKAFRGDADDAE